MAPVVESSERPAGSEGETDQEVTGPPLVVGVTVVMAVPLVRVNVLGLYVSAEGATSLTSMVTSAVVLPPVLVAVTVYVAEEVMAVGVPLMAPFEESSERPAGREGETDQEVTVPPLDVGVAVVIAVPLVRLNEFGLYVKDEGAISLTTISTSAVVLPPVLVAVTVYVAVDVTAVGVPLMAPVDESSDKPDGREGETDQEVTGPPLAVGVTVVMAVPLVSVKVFGL